MKTPDPLRTGCRAAMPLRRLGVEHTPRWVAHLDASVRQAILEVTVADLMRLVIGRISTC
jgi:hypothetical protein